MTADIDIRKVSCSFDRLESVLNSLQQVFQQWLNQATTRPMRVRKFAEAHQLVIVDSQEQRSQFLAGWSVSAGHRPLAVATALEAYTLFLGGTLLPLAIILPQEEASNLFFLQRLVQQTAQKYRWEVPLIFVSSVPVHQPRASVTAPLSLRTITRKLEPLEPEQELASDAAPKVLLEGESLGRYHIRTRLGHGAASDTYETYDRLREQVVALKAVQMRPEVFEEVGTKGHFFQQERDLLSMLDHPHILPLFNSGKSYISGAPFFYKTMPYYPDGSLATWRYQHDRSRPFSPQELIPFVTQVASALQYAHERGILYRNFKLSNFILQRQADRIDQVHVLLADFVTPQSEGIVSKVAGCMHYMAPERWSRQGVPASDQYGLAAIVYELLTGRPPFPGHSRHLLQHMHMTMQPQPPSMFNPAISPLLNEVLLHALAKRPADRFASVYDFARYFEQYAQLALPAPRH